MEGTEPGKILRAGLLQAHVIADDANDVRLLLHGLGKVLLHHRVELDLLLSRLPDVGKPVPNVDRRGGIVMPPGEGGDFVIADLGFEVLLQK